MEPAIHTGESGGPLFDSRHVQVGVVSYGKGCARDDAEDVYTDVAGHYPWIQFNLYDGRCDAFPVGDDDGLLPPPTEEAHEDNIFVDDDDNNCIFDNKIIKGIRGRLSSFLRRGQSDDGFH